MTVRQGRGWQILNSSSSLPGSWQTEVTSWLHDVFSQCLNWVQVFAKISRGPLLCHIGVANGPWTPWTKFAVLQTQRSKGESGESGWWKTRRQWFCDQSDHISRSLQDFRYLPILSRRQANCATKLWDKTELFAFGEVSQALAPSQ
jgi:hypothetical protein